MAEAIYDHDINEAHELLDKLVPGTSGHDESIPERLVIPSERLKALEEIRQRVADGWVPDSLGPAEDPEDNAWYREQGDPYYEDMSPAVAAVLWPDPPKLGTVEIETFEAAGLCAGTGRYVTGQADPCPVCNRTVLLRHEVDVWIVEAHPEAER